jgi:hypothetical protein
MELAMLLISISKESFNVEKIEMIDLVFFTPINIKKSQAFSKLVLNKLLGYFELNLLPFGFCPV